MRTVSKDFDVAAPLRAVYDQWTQFEDFPKFMSGVEEVRQLDDRTLYWLVKVGGVERGFEALITEQRPDERIAWKSTSGPQQAGVVTFHRLSDQETRVRLQLEWEPEGLAENVGAMLAIDEAQVSGDLQRFAELMERNGFAVGAWRGEIPRVDEEQVDEEQPLSDAPDALAPKHSMNAFSADPNEEEPLNDAPRR